MHAWVRVHGLTTIAASVLVSLHVQARDAYPGNYEARGKYVPLEKPKPPAPIKPYLDRYPSLADWQLLGNVGIFAIGSQGGILAGASLRYRIACFELGAAAEAGASVFSYRYEGLAGLAGLDLHPHEHLRFELLATAGEHFYEGVGSELFSSDPGAGGQSPYVGSRTAIHWIVGHKRGRFEIGPYADVEDDLTRRRFHYVYPPGGLFDPGGVADHRIGFVTLVVGVEIGGSRDIF